MTLMKTADSKSTSNDSASDNRRTPWSQLILLHPDNQAVIAVLLLIGAVSLAGFWLWRDGIEGSVVEIDHAESLPYRFTVNINQASAAELAQLPDIGETMASRIIEAREKNGGFHSIDELRNVRGIGPKTFEQLRPYLRPIVGALD
jgi:competence protein ComEA